MSRVPAVLAVIAGIPMGIVAFLETSALAPELAPVIAVGLGTLASAITAWIGRPRIHAVSLVVTLAGVGLTGLSMSFPSLMLATAGAVLAVASLGLHYEIPRQGGHASLVPVTLIAAILAALAGVGAAQLLGDLGGGGLDARVGLAAWIALVAAGTWLVIRHTLRRSAT